MFQEQNALRERVGRVVELGSWEAEEQLLEAIQPGDFIAGYRGLYRGISSAPTLPVGLGSIAKDSRHMSPLPLRP